MVPPFPPPSVASNLAAEGILASNNGMDLPEIEARIAPVKARLLAAGVERLGLFGSIVRGEENSASDVDVLVSFRPEARTFDNLFAVGEALEEAFQRRVDLVTDKALSPYLRPHIESEVRYVNLVA